MWGKGGFAVTEDSALPCKNALYWSKLSLPFRQGLQSAPVPTAHPLCSVPRHSEGEEEIGTEAGSDPRTT